MTKEIKLKCKMCNHEYSVFVSIDLIGIKLKTYCPLCKSKDYFVPTKKENIIPWKDEDITYF